MKKLIAAIATFLLSLSALCAQGSPSFVNVGPYFDFKAGINGGNVQSGRKNGVGFYPIPDFGFRGFLPLKSDYSLGLSCDLGYSSYSYALIDVRNDKKYDFNYGYITLNPCFFISYAGFGFNFGYPLHADFGESISTDKINILAEFQLMGYYPIMYDEEVEMSVFAKLGYMLTGVYKEYDEDDPLKGKVPDLPPDETTNVFNPRVLSLSVGLSYLFTLQY